MVISIHTPFDYRADRYITIAYQVGDVEVDEDVAAFAVAKGFATVAGEDLEDLEALMADEEGEDEEGE